MIEVVSIEVIGATERTAFRGMLKLEPGLNVLSAENAYGKSLAMNAVPWCLGLEPMFGLQNNDPSRFPLAVRDAIKLQGAGEQEVQSSSARVTFKRDDGARLILERAIKGSSTETVQVTEVGIAGESRSSQLYARRETMADETGGLQRFLFEWMHLPRVNLMNLKGKPSQLYLENVAPLFFIDQNEGWTDLQALQVYRYQIQEVAEAAVEYLLGAEGALAARLARQQRVSADARLKGEAEQLAELVSAFFRKQGWELEFSTYGSPSDIARRWSKSSLSEIAHQKFNMDPGAERHRLDSTISELRLALAEHNPSVPEGSASSQASQLVVELKAKRHDLRSELREARMQLEDQRTLLHTTEHRIQSTKDVLRLKTQGIGRLGVVECPTCHRDVEPSSFELTAHSVVAVEEQIESLKKQRAALITSIVSAEAQLKRLDRAIDALDEELRTADRSLRSVNLLVGSARERVAKIAIDLATAQQKLGELETFRTSIAELEGKIDRWLSEVHSTTVEEHGESDLSQRVSKFAKAMRQQLLAFGHSAINRATAKGVTFDERYIPYLGARRMRSLGSASDHARLIAAYVIALAEASRGGWHPGFVVLDEPLQQNPDSNHRKLMLSFYAEAAATTKVQLLVTTSLNAEELKTLQSQGVRAVSLPGKHFLRVDGRESGQLGSEATPVE